MYILLKSDCVGIHSRPKINAHRSTVFIVIRGANGVSEELGLYCPQSCRSCGPIHKTREHVAKGVYPINVGPKILFNVKGPIIHKEIPE